MYRPTGRPPPPCRAADSGRRGPPEAAAARARTGSPLHACEPRRQGAVRSQLRCDAPEEQKSVEPLHLPPGILDLDQPISGEMVAGLPPLPLHFDAFPWSGMTEAEIGSR